MQMLVQIDKYSGFCFGVTNAIKNAENHLKSNKTLYCIGHIVHNKIEELRLTELGLTPINHKDLENLKNKTVLIRAHGEPPSTYITAKEHNIKIIDATCPVVLTLQKKIKDTYHKYPKASIIIFGKKGHAEVNGLVGQTNNTALVISNLNEAKQLRSLNNDIYIFAQTTAVVSEYQTVCNYLKEKNNLDKNKIYIHNTICPSVINRIPKLKEFAKNHDIIIFVSDKESSNGKMLFEICKNTNKNSYFVTKHSNLKKEWFNNVKSVGISGATSTPLWLMENIKTIIEKGKM